MTTTWDGPLQPMLRRLTPRDWLRVARRAVPMALVVFGGLGVLLAIRLLERRLCGARRPATPAITQGVCVAALRLMGLRRIVRGEAMRRPGALVSNHVSWLDIFALNASARICFVSKAEVAGWPGIGWLARATGTVFIRRHAREASAQRLLLQERLRRDQRLLFFPEGTSTDGCRVLPFKTTLFAAFLSPGRSGLAVQPVTLRYVAPPGEAAAFYGWWGDRDFGGSLLQILAQRRQGRVEVVFHAPLHVADFADRKSLARAAEAAVRGGLEAEGGGQLVEPRGGIVG